MENSIECELQGSVFGGGLGSHFIEELRVGDLSILVFVVSLDKSDEVVLADENAVFLQNALEILERDEPPIQLVDGRKGVMHAEERPPSEFLSERLSLYLSLHESANEILENEFCFKGEVIEPGLGVGVVRRAVVHEGRVLGGLRRDDLDELAVPEVPISVRVGPLEEQVELVSGRENADVVEGELQVETRHEASAFRVELLERVQQVEVAAQRQLLLDILDFPVQHDLLLQRAHQVVLLVPAHRRTGGGQRLLRGRIRGRVPEKRRRGSSA